MIYLPKKKPIYAYPKFVKDIALETTEDKRYWLRLKIDENDNEDLFFY